MEPPTTPPRSSRVTRARTPSSPKHGALFDSYEPYSPPRRSTRRTLQNNPYSTARIGGPSSSKTSFVLGNAPLPTPKTPARKLSFSVSEALSTPPASPMRAQHGPSTAASRHNCNDDNNNGSSLAVPSGANSSEMLPTPTKTPSLTPARKRQRAASIQDSSRVLHFQPENPNDAMPTQRQNRKHKSTLAGRMDDSHLDIPKSSRKANSNFQIYTESHARVPEDDHSNANVFLEGRGRSTVSEPEMERARHWDSSPSPTREKTAQDIIDDDRMNLAVRRGEGMIYTFRGKKVYRKFADIETPTPSDPGADPRQQALKRAVGDVAQRPITRSAIRPRLLWTARGEAHDLPTHDYVDEEAETDIEMSEAPAMLQLPETHEDKAEPTSSFENHATPAKAKSRPKPMMSPPTTARTTRQKNVVDIPSFEDALDADDEVALVTMPPTPQRSSRKKKVEINAVPVFYDGTPELDDNATVHAPPTPARARSTRVQGHLTPIVEDAEDSSSAGPASSPSGVGGRRKKSPFDNWPRTKAGRKREIESPATNDAPAKRSRSATRAGRA